MTSTDSFTLTIVGTGDDVEELGADLTRERIPHIHAPVPRDAEPLPFTFEPLTAIIAALGSSGVIAGAAKCLLGYLKERKKRLHLIRDGERLELSAENYDEKQLAHLLSELRAARVVISPAAPDRTELGRLNPKD